MPATSIGTVRRIGAGLAALAALVAFIGGMPLLLTSTTRILLPRGFTDPSDIPRLLLTRDDGTLFIQAVVLAGWLSWGLFTIAVAVEAISRLTGRELPVPGLRTPRQLAGILVAAVATIATSPSLGSAYASPAPAAVITVQATPEDTTTHDEQAATAAEPGWVLHLVERGEALLDLEDRYRIPWQRIAEANYDIAQPDGRRLERGQTMIHAGWQLRVPTAATTTDQLGQRPDAEAPGVEGPGVQVRPLAGQRPADSSTNEVVTTVDQSHTPSQQVMHEVAEGDWMWHIAGRYLGDETRYPEIAALNPGLADQHPGFPDHIEPGDRLILPEDARDRGERPHATGELVGLSTPSRESEQPPAPPQPEPSEADEPQEAYVPGSPDDGVWHPPGTQPPPSSVTPTTPAPSSVDTPAPRADASEEPEDEQHDIADSPGWIQMAGGFISVGLATGLLYAVAMVWKRRRHRYTPTPITTPVLDDPDLSPPLGALTRIRQSLRRQEPHPPSAPTQPVPTVREYTTAEVKPPLPPVGPTGAALAADPALPVAVGVGLAGPAAFDAARALLVATLTSGGVDDPDAQGHVVIPAGTLATLLGVSAVDLGSMQRLTVTPTTPEALSVIEAEIIRRSRIVAEHDVADVAALRATSALAEPLPQMLLITDVPDHGWHTRLATAIQLGTPVEIGAAVIGEWPHGTTLNVASDGTTGADGQRVAVLDTTAAIQMLSMLREAHGDMPPPQPPPAQTPRSPQEVPHTDTVAAEPPQGVLEATGDPDKPSVASSGQRAGAPVQVRVLGTPAILGTDGHAVAGLRSKGMELLVYLAVHRGGAALTDIMEVLWPEATLRRASQRLSTTVANLRSIIRATATTGDETDRKLEPVINTGSHYHLDPAIVDVDWWRVLDAYTKVATAGDDDTKLTHLRTAINTANGGLADGTDWEWIDTDREYVRRHLLKIYAQAADLVADPHEARVLFDTACGLDPLSDELARRAMRAAATVGDADAIRRRLATLRRELEEADIDLNPDTERLAADLLRDLSSR